MRSLADIAVARGPDHLLFHACDHWHRGIDDICPLPFSFDDDGLKQRFDGGKEVLTALIAILGTVVGFYFWSQSSEGSREAVALQPIAVSDAEPAPGETIQISTLASGGAAPYRYTIDFQWPDSDIKIAQEIPDITNKETLSGFISEKISIPRTAAGKEVSYSLVVTDADNRAISMTGERLAVAGHADVGAAVTPLADTTPAQ